MPIQVEYVHEYYGANSAREIAHAAKKGSNAAILQAAIDLAKIISPGSTLIPAPSRHGYATETLKLAQYISEITHCNIADIVKGKPRNSIYESKKNGVPIVSSDLDLVVKGDPGEAPVIIDFVFATGITVASIAQHIKGARVAIYARDSTVDLVESTRFLFTHVSQKNLISQRKLRSI